MAKDENKEVLDEKKVITMKEILGQGDNLIQERRAARMVDSSKMSFNAIIDRRKKEIYKLEDQLEAMNDISASNSTLSANAVDPVSFDSESYVEKRCKLILELDCKRMELESLLEDGKFYGNE